MKLRRVLFKNEHLPTESGPYARRKKQRFAVVSYTGVNWTVECAFEQAWIKNSIIYRIPASEPGTFHSMPLEGDIESVLTYFFAISMQMK